MIGIDTRTAEEREVGNIKDWLRDLFVDDVRGNPDVAVVVVDQKWNTFAIIDQGEQAIYRVKIEKVVV
jgi:hypothetical protein